jgi:hypothetical protein
MRRHPPIARRMNTGLRQVTVRLPFMARQTPLARRLIMIRRHARRTQFRTPSRRSARRVIFSGDAVPVAVDGGGCAIRRSLPDRTAAMVRHPARPITDPIEGFRHSVIRSALKAMPACSVPPSRRTSATYGLDLGSHFRGARARRVVHDARAAACCTNYYHFPFARCGSVIVARITAGLPLRITVNSAVSPTHNRPRRVRR